MTPGAASLHVDPEVVQVDLPARTWVSGLAPGQRATVTATVRFDSTQVLFSRVLFRADERGRIDLTRQAPDSGSYSGVDPMGLIWSAMPRTLNAAEDVQPLPHFNPPGPATFGLDLIVDGKSVDHRLLTQRFLPDGARRLAVRDSGLVGTLIIPPNIKRPPTVIVVGGSEGGLVNAEIRAMPLAAHGFATLALAYFRAEDLPDQLVEIPLEYFERAIRWLRQRSDLDSGRLGLLGVSRGGELALLLAANISDIRAVVAYSPINVVSYGVPRGPRPQDQPRRATWTYRGVPLPFYAEQLPAPDDAPEVIPVERIRGPVLVIAGGDDRLAPSVAMAEAIMGRLARNRHAYGDSILTYPEAGHSIALPYLVVAPRLSLGGTPVAIAHADRDSWSRVLRFFAESLRRP
jgi:dienelactone hydrolase